MLYQTQIVMKIGTRSVLYGAHCFFIHPFVLALAWFKIYGLRSSKDPYIGQISFFDPRLWIAFILHDIGYFGKPNMDGLEGEMHPYIGGYIMGYLFGWHWYDFVTYHSRFLAKHHGVDYSLLCVADKLAIAIEPWWFYLPRVILSGEIKEYMKLANDPNSKYGTKHQANSQNPREWHRGVADYCRAWAYEHRDGKIDIWTGSD